MKVNHNIDEDSFKAALFKFKVYENPEVSMHMQMKQQELMFLAMQQNPMAMGGGMGGMGGMGGNPSAAGMGGMPFWEMKEKKNDKEEVYIEENASNLWRKVKS